MNGKLYVVGVGPGDPELLTLKAARILRSADAVAAPSGGDGPGLAYRIASEAVPELEEKERILLSFPMTNDRAELEQAWREAAERLGTALREGKQVALVTLGDPSLYSTAAYVSGPLRRAGYPVETVAGVPSFCAAAARLDMPLVLGEEALLIAPAGEADLARRGTVAVMKAGRELGALRKRAEAAGREACLVENCGLASERIIRGRDALPDRAGYYSVLIVR